MTTLLFALLFLLGCSGAANAGPIIGVVIAAAGVSAAAAPWLSAGLQLALGFGANYIASSLLAKPESAPLVDTSIGGSQLDIRADADIPRSIIFGRAVTAGSLVYVHTYGSRGDIDNSDLIEIIAIADHRCHALVKAYVDEKEVTWAGEEVDGYGEKLFSKFYNGAQTTADVLAVAELGGATDQPWTTAMVGKDITYVRVHAKYHQEKITSPPAWKFVIDGIKLYDPSKDTTVGGSGSHRWGTESTYEWTENPAVIIYNILRGIYVSEKFLYGIEGTAASQLPLDVWFAAMNSCDVAMVPNQDLTARYRAGGEILVDTEPLNTIKEFLKCCGGRLVEIGGIYKLYVDAPELPVASFADGDVVASHEEIFKPVLPLEQRINYITGKYTSPNNWAEIVAPPRGDAERELADGRRLPADLSAPMVQYDPQMQRLMRQLLERSKRERKHTLTLPPNYFFLEPGDPVEWNSTRNGYIDKLFEVDSVEYHANLCVTVQITEIDPADFDWVSGFKLPAPDVIIIPVVPGPKAAPNFTVVGTTESGDGGTVKPGIRLLWTAPTDGDINRVHYQIRRPTLPLNITNGVNNDPASGREIITSALAPQTLYDVRARFNSHAGYIADWSLWIPVTTTNARISSNDFIAGLKQEIDVGIRAAILVVDKANELTNAVLAAFQSKTKLDIATLTQNLIKTKAEITAAYKSEIAGAIGPNSALAKQITSLSAVVGAIKAGIKASFVVGVLPGNDTVAAYRLELTAGKVKTAMSLAAVSKAPIKAGDIWFEADRISFGKSGSGAVPFKPILLIETGPTPRVVLDGNLIAKGSIKALSLAVASLSAIAADLGTVTAGKIILEKKVDGVVVGKLELLDDPLSLTIWDNSGP